MQNEMVVLVDKHNNVVGTMSKATVHGKTTPLHRGFSLFIFNSRGELLMQQRALTKKTWPEVWSNSCCGHPAIGESNVQAALRRSRDELGVVLSTAIEIAPYRYRFQRDGIEENEICPILVATTDAPITPNPSEVAAILWKNWDALIEEIRATPGKYSGWCEEEVIVLRSNPQFSTWYKKILNAG